MNEIIHGVPAAGSGLTPCCGRTPFELPLRDRITSEGTVTCPGPVRVPGEWYDEPGPAAAETTEPGLTGDDGQPVCTCTYGARCPLCRD